MSESFDPLFFPPPQHTSGGAARQPSELEKVYRSTDYRIDPIATPLVIHIDALHPALDDLLLQQGCETWAFVSAHNPGSLLLSPAENQERHQLLEHQVIEGNWGYYQGHGVGAGDWPEEASLLILGISEDAALALARRFGQLAIVFGRIGEPARLLWT